MPNCVQALQALAIARLVTLCALPFFSSSNFSQSGHTFLEYLCTLQLFLCHFLSLRCLPRHFCLRLSLHLISPQHVKSKGHTILCGSEQRKVTQPVSGGLQTPYKQGCLNPGYPGCHLQKFGASLSLWLMIPNVHTMSQSSCLRPKSCFLLPILGEWLEDEVFSKWCYSTASSYSMNHNKRQFGTRGRPGL